MAHFATYLFELSGHAVKRRLREGSGIILVMGLVARGLLYALLAALAFLTGLQADVLLSAASPDMPAEAAVERYFLQALLVLPAAMLLLPTRPRIDPTPYRFLPIPHHTVATAAVLIQAARLPLGLLAALAFGLAVGVFSAAGWWAAASWLIVALGFGFSASVLGTLWRRDLRTRPVRFLIWLGSMSVVVIADLVSGLDLLGRGSAALVGPVMEGGSWPVAVALLAVATVITVAARSEASQLRYPETIAAPLGSHLVEGTSDRRLLVRYADALAEGSPTFRMVALEFKLIRRCAYPRYQFRAIAVMLGLLLVMLAIAPDDVYSFVTMLLVVAGLPATYVQLAFAWNSDHFDGLFALPISAAVHVRARWLVSVVLAVIAAAHMLLFMLALRIGNPLDLGAVLLLTVGCLVTMLMLLAIRFARSVSLEGSGTANLKAYSWHFYMVILALWMGTQLALLVTTSAAVVTIYAVVGVVGIACLPSSFRYLTTELKHRIPDMAERLRTAT